MKNSVIMCEKNGCTNAAEIVIEFQYNTKDGIAKVKHNTCKRCAYASIKWGLAEQRQLKYDLISFNQIKGDKGDESKEE